MESSGPHAVPDDPPRNEPEPGLAQTGTDSGMAEGGRLIAIERRLLHIDRVTEDTAANVKAIDKQVLMLLVGSVAIVTMVYILSRGVNQLGNASPS
jgi:hypothetical protein